MTDEQQLIEQSRRDPERFRELYAAYFPRIYGYVAYRVRRSEDAEDIVAEVFMRVVHNLQRFEYRGEGSFAAWIFRIAYNEVSQFHRASGSESLSLDELPEISAHQLAPDQALVRKETFAQLSGMIASLSPRRRDIVTLRFFGGLRNREIAAILNLDERSVASHLSRALDDLRRKYDTEKVQPYE
jgi:RNA polymerase sigma-70 factor (ECF subfamily)